MDWRSGKPNTTNTAFRGISNRGRGRGRGKSTPIGRGGHPIAPTDVPATLSVPTAPAQMTPTPPPDIPPRPKPSSHRGSHQHRRAPSLSHLDLPKSGPAFEGQRTTNSHPQIARRGSHSPMGVSQSETTSTRPQIPSLKIDTSSPSPISPASPRPKASRKRSQNRTRSSSKGSTQDRLSVATSVASSKEKETPPHLALASAPPDVQSFDLRTNIDTLVERVRAMAMAGSAVDRGKDKESHLTSNDGHIDWAGEDDDTLPDLDDWVRPKSAEPKGRVQVADDDKPVLSPVEETGPSLASNEKEQETRNEENTVSNGSTETPKSAAEAKEPKPMNGLHVVREKESISGRTKTRGKHSRKKGSISRPLPADVDVSPPVTKPLTMEPATQPVAESDTLPAPKIRPPLVHPLPPKPQLAPPFAHVSKSRAPPQATQQGARSSESTLPELTSVSTLAPPIELAAATVNAQNSGVSSQATKKGAFSPTIDSPNTSHSSRPPITEANYTLNGDGASSPASSAPQNKKWAFDTTVDWANAPRSTGSSPTRRSPSRRTASPRGASPLSTPYGRHPQTAPPSGRSRDPIRFSPRNASPVFSDIIHDAPHPTQTRSQVNSPEPSLRQWHRGGSTHLRSHSSPQTGPGTRTHASRPVITLDAISRISRTLGVPGSTTPPRGQTLGVAVNE